MSEQISGIYWIRLKNLEEKIREEMEENFKCIAGGSDGWKSWNDRICRRYERMLTRILQLEEKGLSSEQAKTEAFYAIKEGR